MTCAQSFNISKCSLGEERNDIRDFLKERIKVFNITQNHKNERMTIRREDDDVILFEMAEGARYKTGKNILFF